MDSVPDAGDTWDNAKRPWTQQIFEGLKMELMGHQTWGGQLQPWPGHPVWVGSGIVWMSFMAQGPEGNASLWYGDHCSMSLECLGVRAEPSKETDFLGWIGSVRTKAEATQLCSWSAVCQTALERFSLPLYVWSKSWMSISWCVIYFFHFKSELILAKSILAKKSQQRTGSYFVPCLTEARLKQALAFNLSSICHSFSQQIFIERLLNIVLCARN